MKKEFILSNQKAVLNVFLDPRYKKEIFMMKKRPPQQSHHDKNPLTQTIKEEFDFEESKNEIPVITD